MHHLDPDYLPETHGILARFLLNPKADIDGLLLTDGTEIHTPPHLSAQLAKALRAGEKLSLRGVKPRNADVIVAVAVDPANGRRILDEGPHDRHAMPHPAAKAHRDEVEHAGEIQALLHGPKGNVHGTLLSDGVIVRFPSHTTGQFSDLLVAGATMAVRGKSLSTEYGTVIETQAIGCNPADLKAIAKPPGHGPKKHEHE